MARTIFGPGTIVSSRWLNASQSIKFDGADEDWSYPPLTIEDINLTSLATGFVDITTDQEITGLKTFNSVLPQSALSATQPDDFVTFKDITGTSGFLRVTCANPGDGDVITYDGGSAEWICTNVISGGTF